ncbi:glycosyl hydrolase family 28-related protein [Paraflavisolibacter caeni]|nr:glycosyl hydrolase family 28-related protein [Paraflavisolibacter caeni]
MKKTTTCLSISLFLEKFSVLIFVFAIFVLIAAASCKKTVIEKVYESKDSSNINSPEFIITNFGAKGDGKTDCSSIINDLILKMPAAGGTIVIPEGDFLLNNPIVVSRNFITIQGLNPGLRSNVDIGSSGVQQPGGGSKLLLGNTAIGIHVPSQPDVNGRKNRISGLVIKNLLISGGQGTKGTGISIVQDNDGVRIENVIGINLNIGIYAEAADAMIISTCWISECRNSIEMKNGIQNMITNCQLGAQPSGITVNLTNQENFNFTSNHVYPDGDVNLQLNNTRYANISSNNFQSYYVGMIEVNGGHSNLVSSNVCWLRVPGDTARQLRGKLNDYGVIRVSGDNHLISSNSIACNWANPSSNPVTIRSESGSGNRYQNLKINDVSSSRVFYVNETSEIFNCVPYSKVYVDGDVSKVYVKY